MREYEFSSTNLSLYGRIQVTENPYSRIFYAVLEVKEFIRDISTDFHNVWDEGNYSQTTIKWDLKKLNKFF